MTEDKKTIDTFVKSLTNISWNHCENPWKIENHKQQENLKKFLTKYGESAKYILIGEAPGRKGCVKSGVPFCDCNTLQHLLEEQESKENNIKETSAQRIYKTFGNNFIAWNVFPIQPCKENGTNRTPKKEELNKGAKYLKDFLDIFLTNGKSEKKIIILFGSKAQKRETEIRSICGNNVEIIKVIHPSPLADRYWKNDSNKEWKDYVEAKIKLEKQKFN